MNVSRRDFLKISGGLTFAFSFPLLSEAQAQSAKPINAWVSIAPDGTVTILSTGAEMGQGSMTSLPLILADEMDADWSKVKVEWAPADPTMYGYTFQNVRVRNGNTRNFSSEWSNSAATPGNDSMPILKLRTAPL